MSFSGSVLSLHDWLRDVARIPEERLASLLKALGDQWIDDVETLRRCHASKPAALEKLPAAAWTAINEALSRASPPKLLMRPTGSLHQFLFRMVFYPDYEAGLTENLDAYLFYFLACWLTLIYLMLAFSNPGRIESSVEKFLLNQRF